MSDNSVLGWGIVSTGKVITNQIRPAISNSANSTLAAVYSRDLARAKAFTLEHGGNPYDSYESMLSDPAVDAVYIASPNAVHAEQVVAAARAGKHVLCDKPLAIDEPDALRAIAACAESGVGLGVTFQSRFFEGMPRIRQAIAAGTIGSVITGHLEMSAGRSLLAGWRTDPALAGVGTINNIGVHGYDLLRYLLGAEVVEVAAMTSSEVGLELETTALALLRFDSGALISVQVNQSVPDHRPDLVVYGSTGRIIGTNVTRPGLNGEIVISRSGAEEPDERISVSTANGYRDLITSFAGSVLDGGEPSPSGADALVSVQVTAALAAAAHTGCSVRTRPAPSS